MKKRVLFVDDEENILQGLKRMLRPLHSEWDIDFANSGEEALKVLQKNSEFDCIISDMRMPGMDGATLLTKVHDEYPNIARFILSGHAELEPIMQAIPVTHQFLAKPCNSEKLVECVQRACGLHNLVKNPDLIKAIGSVNSLPARPEIYTSLTQVIADPNSCMDDIAKIIEKDVAITSKILQVVNSAFFGLAQNISNVRDAVSYLGIGMVKSLVLSQSVFRSFNISKTFPDYPLETISNRCLRAANITKKILSNKRQADDAFMAAMLQKIGDLIAAQNISDQFRALLNDYKNNDQDHREELEQKYLGATVSHIGAYLLGLWGLPYQIVEAVAYSNTPWQVEHNEFQILDAVYVANKLVLEQEAINAGIELQQDDLFNAEYLEKMNIDYALKDWREIAQSMDSDESKAA